MEGPHAGQKIKTKVSSFTEEKWAAADARRGYGVPFNGSMYEQRRWRRCTS